MNLPLSARLLLALLPLAPLRAAEPAPAEHAIPAAAAATTSDVAGAGVWTLSAALERAMQANPDLMAAKFDMEREAGVRFQVRARLLPRLTVSGSADERQDRLIDRSPGELNVPPSLRNAVATQSYDVRVEFRQAVFDGLNAWHQLRAQKLKEKEAYFTFVFTANRIASLVHQGFDAVLLRRRILETEHRRVDDLAQLVAGTARKHAVGEVAEFELLTAQSRLQAARSEASDAERDLIYAEQSFRRLLQLPDTGGPLLLDGALALRAFTLGYDDARDLALGRRPDLKAAGLAVDAARLRRRALVGEMLPRFEVFANYSARSSYFDSSQQLRGITFGAVGQWSLFDGLENAGRRRVQLVEQRMAEAKLAETEHAIVSRLRELYQTLEQSRQSMTAQESSRDLAARAAQQARRLFEAGQASLEQVLQTEVEARRAENRYQETVFNTNAAVAQIEFSIAGDEADHVEDAAAWKP